MSTTVSQNVPRFTTNSTVNDGLILHANSGSTITNDGLILHANGGSTVANVGLKSYLLNANGAKILTNDGLKTFGREPPPCKRCEDRRDWRLAKDHGLTATP